jgi:DNA polymerase-1
VWKVFRTEAKIFSFQRAYGAGAKTIAEATGMSIEDVEALIVAELEMYPEVEEYYAKVEAEINRTAVPIRAQRDNGSYGVYRRGHYTAPTGTRYSWRSYDAPAFLRKRGITDTFSPPEIRNYPVQGTGGEFVQCVLGLLIRNLIAKDFYGNGMFDPLAVLCNTVHDCVWYDCATEELSKRVWADIQPIMESIPAYYNKHHGMDITVPFPVDGEVGLNMNELGHFH